MKLTIPIPPSVNVYWRIFRNRMILSADARKYKRTVGIWASRCRLRPIDGEIKIIINVYRPRRAGDLDNYLKGILDSLKGFAFHDDKQIININAARHDDASDPRVEIEVFPIGSQLDLFGRPTA